MIRTTITGGSTSDDDLGAYKNLNLWKDWDEVIAIQHGVELHLLEVWHKFNCSGSIDINQHKLVDKMCTKVGKMCQGGCNLGKVAGSDRAVNAQTICFKKDALFLQPGEKIAVSAAKLDVAETAVTQDVAANANLYLVLFFKANGHHFKIHFKFRFSCWKRC